MWSALESASLKPFFSGQEKKLAFNVAEGGGNLRYYRVIYNMVPTQVEKNAR